MKILTAGLMALTTLIVWLTVHQYFFCPRFSFEPPQPFRGEHLYNPYQDMDSSAWALCNFHAHSSAWAGLTNGNGTPQDIWSAYDSLGYSIHLVSDYQKIDHSHEYHTNFIPAYEHGYNVNKVHHLVLGDQVEWLDYLLPQILSNKQWILNQLGANKDGLVILNHPDMRNGVGYDDVKYLTNYRCMEILSPYSYAVAKWDSALSAGKPIFIIGSDDIHNVFERESLGRFCTVVNAKTPNKENVLNSLRLGNSYGMELANIPGENFKQKITRLNKVPRLTSYRLKNNTIELKLDRTASEIIFIGQHGKPLGKANQSTRATYEIKTSDEYVRATAAFSDGTMMHLNPVFRYQEEPFRTSITSIDKRKSFLFAVLGVLILLGWGLIMYQFLVKTFWKPRAWRLPVRLPDPQQG